MEEELQELKVYEENHIAVDSVTTDDRNYDLLTAVLNNNIDEIQHIIETSPAELIKERYSDYGNKTILIIACLHEDVSKDTLRTLYTAIKSHQYYINCIDEDWYKWEPIHHVAKAANPEKLEVLVHDMDTINSLTVFSENALHVLLEYEKSIKPFNALLYKGPESRDCTIISTEKERTVQCAKILIDAGIDVNHSNFWNETPICIAARYRYREIIKILLNTPYIDLDNYREEGIQIREYLKRSLLQESLSQSTFPHDDPIKILFNFLKSENEELFLEYNNENIKDYVNYIDGDSERNTCGNMLQLCFKKGFLEYIHHELYKEELIESNIMDTPMLTTFLNKGLSRCIEHLLNNGADPKLTYRKFPEPLLEAAAVRGYYPLVAILLQHKASTITFDNIFEILPKLFEHKYDLNNHNVYRKYVLCLLLNKLLALKGNTVLTSKKLSTLNGLLHHLNIENDDEKEDDSENICQILKLGASLTNKMNNGKMVIDCIHPDLLRLHFDDCIDNNTFCYNSFIEDNTNNYSETRALGFLVNDSTKKILLKHPLLIHFIHNKWLKIFYFFYFDLLLYTTFLFSIYAYMICIHVEHNSTTVKAMFYMFLLVHFIKEGIQLIILYRWKYFLDISNYFEVAVMVCCLITIFYKNEYTIVISILISTAIFLTFLGQLPICAKYTIIFGSTKYFLQYAAFYFMQFLSFALVFYIIFPFPQDSRKNKNMTNDTAENAVTEDTLGDISKSMFYTLIIFTGEFNDRVLEPDRFPVFGRIIMTVFIFCMTIILNNLLVGLIVADMDEMQRVGKLYKEVRTANFIVKTNSLVKRLHDFKTNKGIKNVINFLHIFKKRQNKFLDISNCNHDIFDGEDKKYLKDIKNKKTNGYKNILKNLYALMQTRERKSSQGN